MLPMLYIWPSDYHRTALLIVVLVNKVIQSRYMEWDHYMSTDDGPMTARTSSLTDELALVS